eukprot:TRINITY_DN11393_c0_g3_i1.p1 TRINITY_DN11393_c0_g3~~TRINITY_DN11393_c0_g3_i1.p1  ORF type:complete len:193 (+),score=26.28 TRINITY_DN11393_c0_g3_i1:103-681(+)
MDDQLFYTENIKRLDSIIKGVLTLEEEHWARDRDCTREMVSLLEQCKKHVEFHLQHTKKFSKLESTEDCRSINDTNTDTDILVSNQIDTITEVIKEVDLSETSETTELTQTTPSPSSSFLIVRSNPKRRTRRATSSAPTVGGGVFLQFQVLSLIFYYGFLLLFRNELYKRINKRGVEQGRKLQTLFGKNTLY